jgi:uncharacterized protein (TIGR03437 family)
MTRFILGLTVCCGALSAQPVIFPKGIVNAGSFARPGLPGGAIARGSVFSIFGTGLGPAAPAQVSAFPLPTTLAGVSIRLTQGATAVDILPLVAVAGQINALMPSNSPLGLSSLQVTFNGVRSNPSPVTIVNNGFGIFTANSGGFGPGIVQNVISGTEQPINSLTATAQPGQAVILWGTGLGPATFPDNAAPVPGNLPGAVEIYVGGKPVAAADILYAGRTPCCSGIDQLVFRLPRDAPEGCYVPVFVRSGTSVVSNSATMAIRANGQSCADAANPFSAPPFRNGRSGVVALARGNFRATVDVRTPVPLNADIGIAAFRQETGGPFAFNPIYALPPPGSCTVYTGAQDLILGGRLPGLATTGRMLDAGVRITATGTGAPKLIPRVSRDPRNYFGVLGATLPGLPNLPGLFLTPGAYTLAGSGGADVGTFQTRVTATEVLAYGNLSSITNVNRANPLTLTWSMPAPAVAAVAILGANYDAPTDSSSAFLCLAPPADRTFTVPAYVLGALPASRTLPFQSTGLLILGTLVYDPASAFTASGLDAGLAVSIGAAGQTVLYQ